MATTEQHLADTIREVMEERGTNVNALHVATGIPHNTLKGRVNTGHNLKVEELRLIAQALGTDAAELWSKASTRTLVA